jgi:hypothetical protein
VDVLLYNGQAEPAAMRKDGEESDGGQRQVDKHDGPSTAVTTMRLLKMTDCKNDATAPKLMRICGKNE